MSTGKFTNLALEIGNLVDEKNRQYGDSFKECEQFIRLLYPNGVQPEAYGDLLCIVRMWDKLKRIGTAAGSSDPGNEEPYKDLAGYALLGLESKRNKT